MATVDPRKIEIVRAMSRDLPERIAELAHHFVVVLSYIDDLERRIKKAEADLAYERADIMMRTQATVSA